MNVPLSSDKEPQALRRVRETKNVYSADDAYTGRRPTRRGRSAVEQARLIMLVMINVAQLWILAATVEAALAHHYRELFPLVIASGVCWLIAVSIILWWKPASRRHTSTGYVREGRR